MTGENVPYRLRVNKSVERKLFIDLLTRVSRYISIDSYKYISFGGAFLEDFKLIHSTTGISKMVSIEKDENTWKRQQFNKPFSCIECKHKASNDFITDFEREDDGVIVWLDYTNPKELLVQLGEFEALLSKLERHDILKITINANPNCLADYGELAVRDDGTTYKKTRDETHEDRFQKFRDRVDDEYIPSGAKSNDMDRSKYPNLLNRVIKIASEKGMQGKSSQELYFQHLASFAYSDSKHQMLTVTGMILQKDEKEPFSTSALLHEWGHGGFDWVDVDIIQIPAFSNKEKLIIDSLLPNTEGPCIQSKLDFMFGKSSNKSLEAINNYIKYYRYFPNFQKIEI